MNFTFGGVDFSCSDAKFSFPRVLGNLLPLDYVSSLVAKTYDDTTGTGIKQQVLDALSPFQLVSKAWAVYALRCVPIYKPCYYPGSWFGQLAVAVQHVYREDYARWELPVSHTLIDLDPECCAVARSVTDSFLTSGSSVLTLDIHELAPPSEPSVVLWTGLEHFDLDKVQNWVHNCPIGTIFLCQGTDMPAPDHVSPISSPEHILSALRVDPNKVNGKGSLYCSIGTRHQVVFTL